jgi:adenosylhomocysteine nucleosidase
MIAPANQPTAIVAPLHAELAMLLRLVQGRRRAAAGGQELFFGRLAGEPVVLAATGDGAAAAARGLAALLAAVRPRRLLVLGVAGGLAPGLPTGALIVARRVVEEGREAPAPDAEWLSRAGKVSGAVRAEPGTIVTCARILRKPDEKAARWRALAELGAAAVDLESAAYARVAAAAGVPYILVRAVLDPAEERLPLDFDLCRRPSGEAEVDAPRGAARPREARTAGAGGVSAARVLWRAVLYPPAFPRLWDLRRRLRRCSRRLADIALELVAEPPGAEPLGIAAGRTKRPQAQAPESFSPGPYKLGSDEQALETQSAGGSEKLLATAAGRRG